MAGLLENNQRYFELKGKIKEVPKVDNTLSVSGCGADAKVTGEKFAEIHNVLKQNGMPVLNTSGTYTGNGSSVERFVDTNCNGVMALVYNEGSVLLVTPKGAFKVTLADGNVAWESNISINEGLFKITTNNDAVNKADTVYNYQII